MAQALHVYLHVIIAGGAGIWAYSIGMALVAVLKDKKAYGTWIWRR